MNIYENLHRGYFPGKTAAGKEKQPDTAALIPANAKPLDNIAQCPNILGYLKQDIVMVDFDSKADSEAFLRILARTGMIVPYLITTKGMHFYFLANEYCRYAVTKRVLACGLKADFKLGSKAGLDLIKYQGQWRQLFNPTATLIEMPDFCKPLNDKSSYDGLSLSQVHEGSRDDTLYKFNGALTRAGFSMERAQMIIRTLINPCVLPEPLSYEQCLKVTRNEIYATEQKYTNDRNFSFHEFGAELINDLTIIKIGETLYYFTNNAYEPISLKQLEVIVSQTIPTLNSAKRTEVVKWVELNAPYKEYNIKCDPNLNYIAFNNGWLNLNNMGLEEPNPSLLVFNRIPHDYNPNTTSALADKFINDIACGDPEIVQSLYEMIGHCFYRRNIIRGCFILIGEKRNGKSTLFSLLAYILGYANVSQLKLHQIEQRFMTGEIQNKLANIGDDISDVYIEDANNLKSAASSDDLVVEKKGVNPYKITPYATLIFSCNNMPRINDVTEALLDRITFVPCKARFDPSNPNYDANITDKLMCEEVAQAIINKALFYFVQALARKSLTLGSAAKMIRNDYAIINNPIKAFLTADYPGLGGDINHLIGRSVNEVYTQYMSFCSSENIKTVARNVFSRRIKSLTANVETVKTTSKGATITTFIKKSPQAPAYIV